MRNMSNNEFMFLCLVVFLFLIFGSLLVGCSYKNVTTPIIYNEHQGMTYCQSDSTWYNSNLVDLVCKD